MTCDLRYFDNFLHEPTQNECPRSPMLRPSSLQIQLLDSDQSNDDVLSPRKLSFTDKENVEKQLKQRNIKKKVTIDQFLEGKKRIKRGY